MGKTMPTRLDLDLFEAAKDAAALWGRSAAQQVAHWCRIGLELESSSQISHGDVAAVLAGRTSYDMLPPDEQALVRAVWAEAIAARREALDLASEFDERAMAYVEADDDGNVVRREPRRGTTPSE